MRRPKHLVSRWLFLILSFFTLSFLGQPPAEAAPLKPLRDLISFEDFSALIRYNSARVPELSKLWTENGKVDTSQAFWGGGSFRGFLHWHYVQLQNHSIEEVKAMGIPPLTKLQLPGGKDIDIFAPAKTARAIKKILKRVRDLDVLDLANVPEYVKLGGATIEKIAVNPNGVLDLSGGFRHYWEGRIVFHFSDDEEIKSSRFSDDDYTKTGESIRFIRFAHFNLPELENDPGNVELIRRLAPTEIPRIINEEGRLAWIEISLEKLFYAGKGDLPKILGLLHDYNLLVTLLRCKVIIPDGQAKKVRQWFLKNQKGLTSEEVTAAKENYPFLLDQNKRSLCEPEVETLS